MSKPHLLSVEESAALGAKLSQVDVVVNHPMPFSINIANELSSHTCKMIECSTLSGAVNASLGASLGGKRTFMISSIPKAVEDIFTLSYMRLPVVITNISRPIGTYTVKHDHSDISPILDAGCLIFMPESNQEVVETIIQAYKVSEDQKVMLPSIVNIDITNYREQVNPVQEPFTKRFLGRYKPLFQMDKKPKYFAMQDDKYAEFKKQQHRSLQYSMEIIEKSSKIWQKKYRHFLPLVESYKLEDAELAIVVTGFHSTTAKAAIDKLRATGKKIGLLRLRVIRPWPSEAISYALKNVKKIAIFDQSISLSRYGILYREFNDKNRCSNYISLGKHPSEQDFMNILDRLEKSNKDEIVWV